VRVAMVSQRLAQPGCGHTARRTYYLSDWHAHIWSTKALPEATGHTLRRTLLPRDSRIHTLGTSSALRSHRVTVYDRQTRMSSISLVSHSNVRSRKPLIRATLKCGLRRRNKAGFSQFRVRVRRGTGTIQHSPFAQLDSKMPYCWQKSSCCTILGTLSCRRCSQWRCMSSRWTNRWLCLP
jgi:hypothetical protein